MISRQIYHFDNLGCDYFDHWYQYEGEWPQDMGHFPGSRLYGIIGMDDNQRTSPGSNSQDEACTSSL
ncbi:MAG: hypothetical protein MJA30_02995 [Cytophagales bacterium]|nr:hypothetical protein [Cytophagales bacterium]